MSHKQNALSFEKLFRVCRIFLRFSGIITVDPVFDNTKLINTWKYIGYSLSYVIGLITTNFLVIHMLKRTINVASTDLFAALETSNSVLAGILIVARVSLNLALTSLPI